MRSTKSGWILAATYLCLCWTTGGQAAGQDEAQEQQLKEALRRKTPSEHYIDPASFFRLHGYVTLSYTEAGRELGAEPGGESQILVPGLSPRTGRNEGGFKNDAALFVGGEPFEGVGTVVEVHFVGDAADPVLTEAKIVWDLAGKEGGSAAFRLVGGRYWWPFGIHNDEWFSAVNSFSLLSLAAISVVPAHYNEMGLMGEGELKLGDQAGLNYVFSVGNGVPGFGLKDNVSNTQFDANGNRALTGRVGLVLCSSLNCELGLSASRSRLRSGEDQRIAASEPGHYAADFTAWGPDLSLKWKAIKLRSYLYGSTEDLERAPVDKLSRSGLTVEPSYTLRRTGRRLEMVSLVGRYSRADEETLGGPKLRMTQLGIGANGQITRAFRVRLGFVSQKEGKDLPDLDNDAFSLGLTAEF
ncbi:MAG: hypothetical protein HYW07_08190 [Candidatus Latescibacteria bacterium]|nr:hypothetical protein [Candidatus Latescibacterota bacterium]